MTADSAPMGLRERKKRATRMALSQATIALCVQRGWDAVTVEDIAAAADVSVRTFRNYFSGKAEAFAASHLERALLVAEELRTRPAEEPLWDAITGAVRTRFAGSADGPSNHGPWRTALRLILAEPALQGEFLKAEASAQRELAAAIAERLGLDVDKDMYPKLVATVTGSAIGVATEHWLLSDEDVPVGDLIDEALARVVAGLPTP